MSKIQGVFGCSGLVKLFAQILSVLLCSCVVVLVAVVHGWESLSNKQQAFVFSLFFLSVFHMDVFPWKSLFFSVSHAVSFSHPSFCLSLSLCLTVSHPFLISPFGPPTAAAGKVLSLFPPQFLPLHSQRLFFWSHISSYHLSIITVDLCTCLLVPFCHCSPWNSSRGSNTTKPCVQVPKRITQMPFYFSFFFAYHRIITEKYPLCSKCQHNLNQKLL